MSKHHNAKVRLVESGQLRAIREGIPGVAAAMALNALLEELIQRDAILLPDWRNARAAILNDHPEWDQWLDAWAVRTRSEWPQS